MATSQSLSLRVMVDANVLVAGSIWLGNLHLVRDTKDVHVALAAIQAEIDILVTQDKDFTEPSESTAFLRQHFDILLPGTFLREHMGWTSEALKAIRNRTWRDLE